MIVYPTPESLEHHPVVPRDQWLIARTELLKGEKEFTRLRDKINAQRRDLPWVRVEKKRMGWRIPWVSSFGSDFNYDYQVSFTKEEIAKGKAYHNYKMQEVEIEEMSGLSVFYKNAAGDVFHTYSTYGRGAEELVSAYVCLDLTPKGRNETGPGFNLGDWVRHHDRYDDDF